jgi:hypothetical protein
MILSTGFLIIGSNHMEKERVHKLIVNDRRRRQQHNNRIIIDTDVWNCCIIAMAAIILTLCVFANVYASDNKKPSADQGLKDATKGADSPNPDVRSQNTDKDFLPQLADNNNNNNGGANDDNSLKHKIDIINGLFPSVIMMAEEEDITRAVFWTAFL